MLVGTPEHNGGYTALLKNTIDRASRLTATGPSGLASFEGKAAALVSASPGALTFLWAARSFDRDKALREALAEEYGT
jgi:NAD(P)H-dependent FMN reductase